MKWKKESQIWIFTILPYSRFPVRTSRTRLAQRHADMHSESKISAGLYFISKILNWLWLFDLLVISASVSLELVYCILSSAEMTLSIPAEAVRKRTIVKRKKKIRNQNALAISRWVMCWLALWLVPRCIFLTPVFLFCYRAGWSRFWPEQFRLGQLCDRRIVETETERKRSWDLNLIMQNNHWVIWNNAFLT